MIREGPRQDREPSRGCVWSRSSDEFSDSGCVICFSMVTLRERPAGGSGAREGSGSGSGAEQLEERMRELISAEVTRSILD